MAESASKLTERLVELACDLLLESPPGDELAASRHALLREAASELEQAEKALRLVALLREHGAIDPGGFGRLQEWTDELDEALAALGGQDKPETR